MEMPTAPSQRKRVRFSYSDEDSDADEAPRAKKVRFPKGKKDSQREFSGRNLGVVDGEEEDDQAILSTDPRVAALERATRRDRISEQLLAEDTSVPDDVAVAEEAYEDDDEERIEDDGMRIEPFNLKQEREEGYFDAEGNYVEYRNEDDTKDAWLDSVQVDTRFAGKGLAQSAEEPAEGEKDLSKQEIAVLKRRIADSLQPGETVLRALRRLKGMAKEGGSKTGRMSGDTKVVFDQLTEDAMKLLDDGDYNIYEEKKETLQREAEGYEALARLRAGEGNGTRPSTSGEGSSGMVSVGPDVIKEQGGSFNNGLGFPSGLQIQGKDDDLDIFGGSDDEDNPGKNSENGWGKAGNNKSVQQENAVAAAGAIPVEGSGYVFDESSGYYYNSELGYYYDINSGLYCSASTHQWYKFDGDQNVYVEVTQ